MQAWNSIIYFLIGLLFIAILYYLAPVLTPFLIGALLAYLVNPLVNRLMHFHLKRLTSVIIVFSALFFSLFLIVLLFIPVIQQQISTLFILIPKAIDWVQMTLLPKISFLLSGQQELFNPQTLKSVVATNLSKASGIAGAFLTTIMQSGILLIHWLLNLIIIPVVTFYLLRDWELLLYKIKTLIPRHAEPTVLKIAKECDQVLNAFFRGQFLVMLAIGIYYSIGLSIIGLNISIVLGLTIGLISIVPYLGIIVGIIVASLAAYLQFGLFYDVLLVWGIFAIGQVLDTLFVTPNLIGNRIGLHPVAVIFAVLAGGTLFGFFGVLLALPVAAVIVIWLRHLEHSYQQSQLYR